MAAVEGSEEAMELQTGTSTGGTAGDGVRKGLEVSQEQESQGIWEERLDRDPGRTGVGEEAATEVDSEVVGRGEADHGEEVEENDGLEEGEVEIGKTDLAIFAPWRADCKDDAFVGRYLGVPRSALITFDGDYKRSKCFDDSNTHVLLHTDFLMRWIAENIN